MNEPPGARARVALTGLTVAEYFRDEEGQDGKQERLRFSEPRELIIDSASLH